MYDIRVPTVTSQVIGTATVIVTPDVLDKSKKLITDFILFVPQVGSMISLNWYIFARKNNHCGLSKWINAVIKTNSTQH
jgi:hypothetical protein